MKLFQYARRFLTTLTLALIFAIATALGTTFYQHDWAVASSLGPSSSDYNQVIAASLEGRARATGKNIQGKAQEARGNITGNPGDRAAGRAKQFEGQTRNTAEDVKDRGASLQERIGATAKNIQGKVQEAVGDVTGNPGDQAAGKAKQGQSNVRNLVEDARGRG